MRNIIGFFVLLIGAAIHFTQAASAQTKTVRAEKVPDNTITVDGKADEAEWFKAEPARNFTDWEPVPGKPAHKRTEARIVYDNTAVYVLGIMYEPEPEKISTQLTERDDSGNADNFGLVFDPYGDDALSYCFAVTAAGVQFDFKLSEFGEDNSWNAVWKSRVSITDTAWFAEFKIPYSALRFSKDKHTLRKINFVRYVNNGRHQSSWTEVDPTADNFNADNGILENFDIEKTPVRLSVSPYLSGYLKRNSSSGSNTYSLKGGADLKYGISESFTLDMMLIPDFGQVRSDDETLNLSPYETYYDEKRSFFLEGTELFDKGNIFYSRRIGGTPRGFFSVSEQLKENEILTENPSSLQLLNATKISGKTKSGTSLGILNGMSLQSLATAEDTTSGETRHISTQHFTNYNVSALQQSLPNNSFVSFINTNMIIPKENFSANVTATEFKLAEKSKTYAIFGKAAYSRNKHNTDSLGDGYSYKLSLEKIKGNFKFEFETQTLNNTYNPNYMGYLQTNNRMVNDAQFSYDFFNPSDFWLKIRPQFYFVHSMNFEPRHHRNIYTELHLYALTKNHLSLWLSGGGDIGDSYDFDETRTQNRYHRKAGTRNIVGGFSSNYAKPFALDLNAHYWWSIDGMQDGGHASVSPRWRPSNSIMLIWRTGFTESASFGYVQHEGAEIVFGLRQRQDIENVLDSKLIFNRRSSLSLRLRHLRSVVDYSQAYYLNSQGRLNETDLDIEPLEFNIVNAYLIYQLEFAPGSFLSLAWQNDILHFGDDISQDYFSGLSNSLSEKTGENTFSVKLLLYLDYFSALQKFRQ